MNSSLISIELKYRQRRHNTRPLNHFCHNQPLINEAECHQKEWVVGPIITSWHIITWFLCVCYHYQITYVIKVTIQFFIPNPLLPPPHTTKNLDFVTITGIMGIKWTVLGTCRIQIGYCYNTCQYGYQMKVNETINHVTLFLMFSDPLPPCNTMYTFG